jgi:hypothetical protein
MPNIAKTPESCIENASKLPTHKYNDFDAELKLVQGYLSTRMATATMTAIDLSIYRPNLCRYKDMLIKKGQLAVVCVSKCQITGFKAQYLTCSPDIIDKLKR